jgi:hypothetical protein
VTSTLRSACIWASTSATRCSRPEISASVTYPVLTALTASARLGPRHWLTNRRTGLPDWTTLLARTPSG